MKTQQELYDMDQDQLVAEVLALQNELSNKSVCQFKSSLSSSYHFAGNALLKLNRNRYMASGVIMTISDISGKEVMQQVCFKDGLSNESINALLEDMQYSYDRGTEFKPTVKRLK